MDDKALKYAEQKGGFARLVWVVGGILGLALLIAAGVQLKANSGARKGPLRQLVAGKEGGKSATAPAVVAASNSCGLNDPSDPDAWLDYVGEHACIPKIVPSHFAKQNGMEPFEQEGVTKPFDLHVYPTDEWYDRAKTATDRCDLELTTQVTGGDKGLADEVVWVSGLLDLKRGEGANGGFQRSMQEYYDRFNRILDRGALLHFGRCHVAPMHPVASQCRPRRVQDDHLHPQGV